jgi:hypothetical protein
MKKLPYLKRMASVEGRVWFNPSTFLHLPQVRTWIADIIWGVVVFLYSMI